METPEKKAARASIRTKTSITTLPLLRTMQQQSGYRLLFMRTSLPRKKSFPKTFYTNWNTQLFFCRIRRIQNSTNHNHRIFSWKKQKADSTWFGEGWQITKSSMFLGTNATSEKNVWSSYDPAEMAVQEKCFHNKRICHQKSYIN